MYQYDVFLSYKRTPPVSQWVSNHFLEELRGWLNETLAEAPRIFVDVQLIETGTEWPLVLRNALLSSRLMVAIWSPSYFRSPWCVAEYRTMMAREQMAGMRTPQRPEGLILPVRYHDGSSFPPEVHGIQTRDFRQYNFPTPAFRETREFLEFIREVQDFAAEIGRRRSAVPEWREDWPVELPAVPSSYSFAEVPTL